MKTFFFCSSPNFKQQNGLIASGEIFRLVFIILKFPDPPFENPSYATVFEHVIFPVKSSHLQTSDNQFGFKAKHGTDLCTFLLKQFIASYVN